MMIVVLEIGLILLIAVYGYAAFSLRLLTEQELYYFPKDYLAFLKKSVYAQCLLLMCLIISFAFLFRLVVLFDEESQLVPLILGIGGFFLCGHLFIRQLIKTFLKGGELVWVFPLYAFRADMGVIQVEIERCVEGFQKTPILRREGQKLLHLYSVLSILGVIVLIGIIYGFWALEKSSTVKSAYSMAEKDFNDGLYRVFKLTDAQEVAPMDRMEKGLELWAWPINHPSHNGSRKLAKIHVDRYNDRMLELTSGKGIPLGLDR